MRTAAVLTFVIIAFGIGSLVFAAQELGPPMPYAGKGHVAAGLGYYYYKAQFECDDGEDLPGNVIQNIVFVQASYGVFDGWEIYGRAGMGDVLAEEVEPDLAPGVDFEGDFKFFGGVGVRGMFKTHLPVAIGPIFQYNFYSGYEDEVIEGVTVEYKDAYDVSIGVAFAAPSPMGIGLIYGGGFAYWAKATGAFDVPDMQLVMSEDYQEQGSVGGFLGYRLPLGSGLNLNFEGQYKSDFTVSVSLNKALGGM
jgi:hypothetical protein